VLRARCRFIRRIIRASAELCAMGLELGTGDLGLLPPNTSTKRSACYAGSKD
jgi:hypothetical protein